MAIPERPDPRRDARQRDVVLADRGRRVVRPAVLGEFPQACSAPSIPRGCSIFPKEIFGGSRRWAEKQFTDLRYWNEPRRAGTSPRSSSPSCSPPRSAPRSAPCGRPTGAARGHSAPHRARTGTWLPAPRPGPRPRRRRLVRKGARGRPRRAGRHGSSRATNSASVSPDFATVVSQAASVVLIPITKPSNASTTCSGSAKPASVNSAASRSVKCISFGPRYASPAWPSTEASQGWRSAVARKVLGGLHQRRTPLLLLAQVGDLHLAENLVQGELHQLVLGGDVPVERGGAGVELRAELAHAQRVDALGVQHLDRDPDDRRAAERGLVRLESLPAGPRPTGSRLTWSLPPFCFLPPCFRCTAACVHRLRFQRTCIEACAHCSGMRTVSQGKERCAHGGVPRWGHAEGRFKNDGSSSSGSSRSTCGRSRPAPLVDPDRAVPGLRWCSVVDNMVSDGRGAGC